jgi:hypothetical protein
MIVRLERHYNNNSTDSPKKDDFYHNYYLYELTIYENIDYKWKP